MDTRALLEPVVPQVRQVSAGRVWGGGGALLVTANEQAFQRLFAALQAVNPPNIRAMLKILLAKVHISPAETGRKVKHHVGMGEHGDFAGLGVNGKNVAYANRGGNVGKSRACDVELPTVNRTQREIGDAARRRDFHRDRLASPPRHVRREDGSFPFHAPLSPNVGRKAHPFLHILHREGVRKGNAYFHAAGCHGSAIGRENGGDARRLLIGHHCADEHQQNQHPKGEGKHSLHAGLLRTRVWLRERADFHLRQGLLQAIGRKYDRRFVDPDAH